MTLATVLQYSKVKFARMEPGSERDKAVLQTASQLGKMMDVWSWDGKQAICMWCSQPYTEAACWAILARDTKECDNESFKLSESDIDLCRGIYIQDKCEGIADKEAREKCYLENAMDIGCEIACNSLADKDKRNLCLAVVKDDFEYCEKIEDQEIYEQCCRECGRSPDGSYVLTPFTCESDCPAAPGGFTKSCTVNNDEKYSAMSCDYLKTRKCKDWRYGMTVGGERLVDEEYTDCTVASITIRISQWESEELAQAQFRAMTEGKDEDSGYLLRMGTMGNMDVFIDCDAWLQELTLDRNYILQIDIDAVGQSEAESLLAQIKPSVMSVISRTE
jgi:hypothetical protein